MLRALPPVLPWTSGAPLWREQGELVLSSLQVLPCVRQEKQALKGRPVVIIWADRHHFAQSLDSTMKGIISQVHEMNINTIFPSRFPHCFQIWGLTAVLFNYVISLHPLPLQWFMAPDWRIITSCLFWRAQLRFTKQLWMEKCIVLHLDGNLCTVAETHTHVYLTWDIMDWKQGTRCINFSFSTNKNL